MTALDLGSATRRLIVPSEPFTSIAYGDKTLAGWGGDPLSTPHPVRIVDGIPGIPRRNATSGVESLYFAPAITTPLYGATFVAFRGAFHEYNSYSNPGIEMCYYTSSICTAQLYGANVHDQTVIGDTFPLTTPHTVDGISVYAFVNNSSEAFVANSLDGVLETVASIGTAPGSTNASLSTLSADDELDVLGIWHFGSVQVSQADAIDTMASIIASLEPSAGVVGGHGVGGSAVASPFEEVVTPPPVTHARPPGGSQTPPDLPDIVIPDDVPDPVIGLVWETWNQPVLLNDHGMPVNWQAVTRGRQDYGRLQIIVEGEDVTWVNGVPTPLPRWRHVEPFGHYGAEIWFPALSVFEEPPAWLKHGANVTFRIVKIAGGNALTFTGVIAKIGRTESEGTVRLTCHGAMFVSNLQLRGQTFYDAPRDIGQEIPRVLNSAVNRRHNAMASVVTGEKTAVTGGGEPLLTGYVQRLLSTAITSDGGQWTVLCDDRTPALVKKDMTTIAWEIQAGQRGFDVDLEDDAAESHNRIFATWVNSEGGAGRGMLFPNWHPDDTPAFPNDDPGQTMTLGSTDADTDTGNGISLWEERMGLPVDGRIGYEDWLALIQSQREMGIPDDGWLGPQTWAETFRTGSNTGTLDGAWRAPLAFAPEVMPFLFGPDGANLGPNPNHDPDVIVVDRDLALGTGVDKSTAVKECQKLLARDAGPGWAGTIRMSLDLPESSRFERRAGENGIVRNWQGEDLTLHVSSVDVNADGGTTGEVELAVDTRGRDYPELASVLERRANAKDPARAAYREATRATMPVVHATFDAESPAGRLDRHAVFGGGFWDIRPMPLGDWGTVNRSVFKASNPATTFCVGIFAAPITANELSDIIGNPLSATDESPWQVHLKELKKRGLMMSWGFGGQPLGYFPRQFHVPVGETGAPVTGEYEDDSAWTFGSNQIPWVWVATMTDEPCEFEARFYAMPGDW